MEQQVNDAITNCETIIQLLQMQKKHKILHAKELEQRALELVKQIILINQ